MKNRYLLFLCFAFLSQGIYAQFYFEQPKKGEKQVSVFNETKNIYFSAWAGGMNSCQFGEVDMNLDGIKDLLVFDRHGDRIMTFLNAGYANDVSYYLAPEYAGSFPKLVDWVIFKDYNNDGREDIFTYSGQYPGIVVYKNVSVTELAFELEVYPFLTSFQGGGEVNILTTDVDYPGIADIDGDGDLDILTFWGLGSFVEYHQNQSMELYGIPDSLKFVEITECWGRFAESDESNEIFLDTCNFKQENYKSTLDRHTGSTFLLFDADNDSDQDLLLGDVDYPQPVFLLNGGSNAEAMISHAIPYFPDITNPVNLFSMPAASMIDVNNDGNKDLLASPFDPSLVLSENYKSAWMYKNVGDNDYPQFNFEMDNFLQYDMIDVGSGAYPVLADYDGDGLLDLFVSNYGYYIYSYYDQYMFLHSVYYSAIALFRNSGSNTEPEFSQVTHNFADLEKLMVTGLYPTFGDLDGDNDVDMIVGQANGTLLYLENTAGAGQEMTFAPPQTNFHGIDVGAYSTPQLFDLNADGKLDLIIGEESGNLNYYENTGSASNPQFTLITDSLGKVNVTNPNLSYTGYSAPCFFKDQNNKTELIVGSEEGKLFYFKNIDENLSGEFTENDSLYLLLNGEPLAISNGIRTGAAIAELDNDGFYELIVGNYSGGLNYYAGSPAPVSGNEEIKQSKIKMELWPNPAKNALQVQFTNCPYLKGSLELFDITGRSVKTVKVDCECIINLNIDDLLPGTYIIKAHLNNGGDVFVNRFIKK